MYFKYLLPFLALFILPNHGDVLEDADDIFELTSKILNIITKSWNVVEKIDGSTENNSAPKLWFTKKKELVLLSNFERITHLMKSTQQQTDEVRSLVFVSLNKLNSLSDALLNGIQINELLESVRSIENDFKTMEDFRLEGIDENVKPTYTSYTLEKFADAMLSYSAGSPHKQMAKIHSFIVPDWDGFNFHTHGGIFNILKHSMENSGMLCNQKQSMQQMIYNLYLTLHLSQLKGFTVMQFSWMLLQTYNKGNFTFEKTKQKEQYEKNIVKQLNYLKNATSSTSNLYWKCDPEKHVRAQTYLEVTQLLQGYIENEADMNYEQSCMQNCGYYEVGEHKTCFSDQFCAKQRVCNGRILNCQFIDSDMRICQSPFGSSRRYDYITYKNGRVLGDSSVDCKGTMSSVDSWWKFLIWHCSYCFCICDSSDASSDRHFSLRPSLSNIIENKVVTGLRFTKVNQMFHLQIQEGSLAPRGAIHEASRQWVPVPGSDFSYRNKTLINGHDYHTLSYTSRAIDLDNLIAPENMVITGVRFRLIGSHLNIEVRVTSYNFVSGLLINPTGSYWIGNDNTELSLQERTQIDISNSNLPTKSNIPSEPDMSSNKYIMFTHSSIDVDVAQTTLPFIDIQTVTPYPGIPLSGVGLYYKGTKNQGGFIGASVYSYNFTNNLNSDLFSSYDLLNN